MVQNSSTSNTSNYGAAAASAVSTFGNVLGGVLGWGLGNFTNQWNKDWSEQQYLKYQSPQALMRQMEYAGINPNLAAQGVSGSSPQLMNTASPVGANFGSLGTAAVDAMNQTALADSQIDNINANTENQIADTSVKVADASYIESKTVGQNIENQNRQMWYDKVLRGMDDQHLLDGTQLRILTADANFQEAVYDGRVMQFWLGVATCAQELVNLEAEHGRILSEINKNYEEAKLFDEQAQTEESRQTLLKWQAAREEENARYDKFRNNSIQKFHWDPQSSLQSNVGFALAIGDTQSATYWMNQMGRYQAQADGWSEEQKGVFTQEFKGYQGVLDFAKWMAGGWMAGSATGSGKAPKGATPQNIPGSKGSIDPHNFIQGGGVQNPGKGSDVMHPRSTTFGESFGKGMYNR